MSHGFRWRERVLLRTLLPLHIRLLQSRWIGTGYPIEEPVHPDGGPDQHTDKDNFQLLFT